MPILDQNSLEFISRGTEYTRRVGIRLGTLLKVGNVVCLEGDLGSGKTTLALGLLRLEKSDGPIVFLGNDIQGLGWKELRPMRRQMQIVFQDPYGSLSPRMSIGQIVEEGLLVHEPQMTYEQRRTIIDEALKLAKQP